MERAKIEALYLVGGNTSDVTDVLPSVKQRHLDISFKLLCTRDLSDVPSNLEPSHTSKGAVMIPP